MLSFTLQAAIRNNKPSTYWLQFFEPVDVFSITDRNGKIYFYRYLPSGTTGIKVNIPDTGDYYVSKDVNIIRKPLTTISNVNNIVLPPKERNRSKPYFIVHDNNEVSSPALIYTGTGMIVTGRKFKGMSIPMRIFILLHELGHFYYETEKYCDLYAFIEFVKMGYNPSTAMYCLTDVLRRKPENDERIDYIYNKMIEAEIIS